MVDKRNFKTLEESQKLWDKWIKEVESSIISNEESLKDVIPIEWSDDVIVGKKKVVVDNDKCND